MGRKEKGKVVEREEEIEEIEEEEEEEMVKEWKLCVKRAEPSTPSPIWRLEFLPPPPPRPPLDSSATVDQNPNDCCSVQEFLTNSKAVSARKLCANLWEIEQLSVPKMRRRLAKLRRDHQNKDTEQIGDDDRCNTLPDQPFSTGSLRKQIAASLLSHHRLVERNEGPSGQPVSPASYNSSIEVAAHKPAFTPTSSLDFKNRNGEPSYSLKTSAELLKVLNRIFSLEEQHASNTSLVETLKTELDQCRAEIKGLQREKRSRREEITGFKNRAEENDLARKNKEQERLEEKIGSVRDELNDEKNLRRRSEDLQRKLARELSEVKSCFSKALKELEKERNARVLLENLCDEFAKAVKEYEQEVRVLKGKFPIERGENRDGLILHISESWLDERLQMKLAEDNDGFAEKKSVVDKLGLDIESFLQLKRSAGSRKSGQRFSDAKMRVHLDRQSLESYPLNYDSNSHCLELNKSANRIQRNGSSIRRDNKLPIDDLYGRRRKPVDETSGLSSEQILDQFIRNQSLSSEGDKIHPEGNLKENNHVEKSESGPKLPENVKENTLRAKLIEARLESRHSRSRGSRASV